MTYEEKIKEISRKLNSKQKLTENEIQTLVWNYDIEQNEGDSRRWTKTIETIIEFEGKNYSILWEQGLTEMQENEYYNQPVEVEKKEYDKIIHIVEWVTKEEVC